jgi:iron complex transport system ATP-binding protein
MSENKGIIASELIVGWNDRAVAEVSSVSVKPGQAVVLGGPNGAGKSTLIKTLAKLVPPLSGRIQLNGEDISAMSARGFARQVSYVPQMVELLQDLTVKELVQLGRNPHQKWWSWQASQSDEDAVKEALERTGTWHLRQNFLSGLSGGERQRASIAMALAQNAAFILLDEPTAHLDFKHQLELIDLMKTLKLQGIGLLIILHDLNLMSRLADDILLLKKGAATFSTPAAYGPSAQVLTRTVLQDVYEVEVKVFTDAETGEQNFVPSRVSARQSTASTAARPLSDSS